MPWLETAPMQQRDKFITDHRRGLYTMGELCARYNLSRKTGYKWLERFREHGRSGLNDRSHAPHHCPHRISEAMATLLCTTRRAHPSWGSEKILDHLRPKYRNIRGWPAFSTVSDLFVRRGLIRKRRRRRKTLHPGFVPIRTHAPNDLWTADFKGHFRTGDGIYCYRSRSPISTRGFFSPATGSPRSKPMVRGRSSSAYFESSDCLRRFAPITAYRSRPARCTVSPSSTCGGCAWVSSISAYGLRHRRKTARTNECTRRSKQKRSGRPSEADARNRLRSTSSVPNSTRFVHTRLSRVLHRLLAINLLLGRLPIVCRPSSIQDISSLSE